MKNKIDKKLVYQACVKKQEELIENYRQREIDLYNDTYDQDAIASQTEDRKAGKAEVLEAFGNEHIFAQKELVTLNDINVSEESTVVEPGAIVVTKQLTFFIGISSESIEVNGDSVFGISTKAPIYANMHGLKKGDQFEFNNIKYQILDLY